MRTPVPRPRPNKLDRLPNDPTPAEIRRLCEAIRQTWDADRLQKNERYQPAEAPTVKAADLDLEADFRTL